LEEIKISLEELKSDCKN